MRESITESLTVLAAWLIAAKPWTLVAWSFAIVSSAGSVEVALAASDPRAGNGPFHGADLVGLDVACACSDEDWWWWGELFDWHGLGEPNTNLFQGASSSDGLFAAGLAMTVSMLASEACDT
jgi:hypothetical protein